MSQLPQVEAQNRRLAVAGIRAGIETEAGQAAGPGSVGGCLKKFEESFFGPKQTMTMAMAILRLCQTAKVTCCASTVRLPLATCHLQHAAANEATEAAAKLQSNLVCASEIERTCTLQKKPREQQSQVSRVSQAAGGWQREKA